MKIEYIEGMAKRYRTERTKMGLLNVVTKVICLDCGKVEQNHTQMRAHLAVERCIHIIDDRYCGKHAITQTDTVCPWPAWRIIYCTEHQP